MKIITTISTYVTIALLTVTLALPGVVRADAWDWNYDYDYGSTGYDYSYDYGSTDYDTSYDYGSTDYDTSYDYGSTDYDTSYDYGSTDYDTSYDYGSTDWNYDYDYGSSDYVYNYEPPVYDSGYESPSYNWNYGSWQYDYAYTPVTYTYDWNNGNDWDWYYEPPIVINTPKPVCRLTLSDTSIDRGDDVTLSWEATNATRVVITDSDDETLLSTSDMLVSRTTLIYPRESTTFTMSAYNFDGDVDTCTRSITVSEPEASNPVCRLDLSDTSITRGDSVRLTWSTDNATRVTITDDNNNTIVSGSDTENSNTLYPRESTTFTMRAYNAQGEVDTCTESIDVDDEDITNSGSRPVCELRVSDTTVRRGMPVLLTWDNTRAREMVIRDQFGNVILSADTDTSRSPNNGRQTVIPNQDVTYTMRVTNNNGSDTCSVSVDTTDNEGGITVDRVPLANVPYTGFDAGPTMMALFYLLLGIWAVAIAYYVMQRKYGVTMPVMATEAVAAAVAAPIASVATQPFNLPTDNNFEKMFGGIAEEPAFSLSQYAAQEHVFVTDEVITAVQASAQTPFAQKAMFDALVAKARGAYPTEHGWLTIDSTRYAALNA